MISSPSALDALQIFGINPFKTTIYDILGQPAKDKICCQARAELEVDLHLVADAAEQRTDSNGNSARSNRSLEQAYQASRRRPRSIYRLHGRQR